MILAAVIVITLFKTFLVDLIRSCCCSNEDEIALKEESDNVEAVIRSERSLTNSYKLENNPDYLPILAIMNPKTSRNL